MINLEYLEKLKPFLSRFLKFGIFVTIVWFLWRSYSALWDLITVAAVFMFSGPGKVEAKAKAIEAGIEIAWIILPILIVSGIVCLVFILLSGWIMGVYRAMKFFEAQHANHIDALSKHIQLAELLSITAQELEALRVLTNQCRANLTDLRQRTVNLADGVDDVRQHLRNDHAKLLAAAEDDDF